MNDAGIKPDLGWLPVARLTVNRSYQRPLDSRASQRLIERLVEFFNWSAFQTIIVVPSGSDWTVIDGQHRVEAAKRRGETHVPAVIVKSATVAEQAALFVSANRDRVAVHRFAVFHARLAAGDPAALRTQAFCQELGVEIPRQNIPARSLKPGQILALAAIERVVTAGDHEEREAVKILLGCWPGDPLALTKMFLRATSDVLRRFPDRGEQLRALLGRRSAARWRERFVDANALERHLTEVLQAAPTLVKRSGEEPFIKPVDRAALMGRR